MKTAMEASSPLPSHSPTGGDCCWEPSSCLQLLPGLRVLWAHTQAIPSLVAPSNVHAPYDSSDGLLFAPGRPAAWPRPAEKCCCWKLSNPASFHPLLPQTAEPLARVKALLPAPTPAFLYFSTSLCHPSCSGCRQILSPDFETTSCFATYIACAVQCLSNANLTKPCSSFRPLKTPHDPQSRLLH